MLKHVIEMTTESSLESRRVQSFPLRRACEQDIRNAMAVQVVYRSPGINKTEIYGEMYPCPLF